MKTEVKCRNCALWNRDEAKGEAGRIRKDSGAKNMVTEGGKDCKVLVPRGADGR